MLLLVIYRNGAKKSGKIGKTDLVGHYFRATFYIKAKYFTCFFHSIDSFKLIDDGEESRRDDSDNNKKCKEKYDESRHDKFDISQRYLSVLIWNCYICCLF